MQKLISGTLIFTLAGEGIVAGVHPCVDYAADCRPPQKHVEQQGAAPAVSTFVGVTMSAPALPFDTTS